MLKPETQQQDVQAGDVRPTDVQTEDAQAGDVRPTDVQTEDAQAGDVQPTDVQSMDAQAGDVQPTDVQSMDAQFGDVQSGEVKPGLAWGGEGVPAWGRRTYIMGIINLTPDSFSGDGVGDDVEAAVALARRMEADGADIIDVGAESTRPGSAPISAEVEAGRLLPALAAICRAVGIPVSVDTYKARVAQQAIAAGAALVNDVWGGLADPQMGPMAARAGVPIVLMHNQREARYDCVVSEVCAGLRRSIAIARAAGVADGNIIVDPGIGFGKTADHNLELLRRLPEVKALGFPVLLGVSRKSTIGRILDLPADDRVEGTAAAVALGIAGGADLVRVHEVKEMARVARMSDAIVRDWRPAEWTGR